jgi:YHS domain-containing protein
MVRNVFRLFLIFLAAIFIRQVIVLITRAFSSASGDRSSAANHSQAPPRERSGGELKKDPVCGTFVAAASSIKRTVDGKELHFCSTVCRDKYQTV